MGGEIQPLLLPSTQGTQVTTPPSFLPAVLDSSGSWEGFLTRLYAVFTSDFKQHTTVHEGLPVRYDNRVLPDGAGKEEGFWHAISKDDRVSGQRLPDYRRAERLPWARPALEAAARDEIRVFDYDHGPKDKGIRRYVWLHGHDYVLILMKRKKAFQWITAYYVDSDGSRRDLHHRYTDRAS